MTGEWMTAEQVADHLGVARDRAPKIMSEHGIRATRVYPTAAVTAIQRPGQGARTDLRSPAHETLGEWSAYSGEKLPIHGIREWLGDFVNDYDLPALAEAYREEINRLLDGTGISLVLTNVSAEFMARTPVPDDAADLIREAIASVDLTDLAQHHEKTA